MSFYFWCIKFLLTSEFFFLLVYWYRLNKFWRCWYISCEKNMVCTLVQVFSGIRLTKTLNAFCFCNFLKLRQ